MTRSIFRCRYPAVAFALIFSLAPPTLADDPIFGPDSTLAIEIRGTRPGIDFDQINFSGHASLDGSLDITTSEDYHPRLLDRFTIMTFPSRSSIFRHYPRFWSRNGLAFAPIYSATDLTLVATRHGDSSLDGRVDFNDLAAMAQSYNTVFVYPPPGPGENRWRAGDFNLDGIIDFNDLAILAQNYGVPRSAEQMAALDPTFASDVERAFAQVQVPEPTLTPLLLMGLAFQRRRICRINRTAP